MTHPTYVWKTSFKQLTTFVSYSFCCELLDELIHSSGWQGAIDILYNFSDIFAALNGSLLLDDKSVIN